MCSKKGCERGCVRIYITMTSQAVTQSSITLQRIVFFFFFFNTENRVREIAGFNRVMVITPFFFHPLHFKILKLSHLNITF